MNLKEQFLRKKEQMKGKYQIIDERGKVLGEYKSKNTAINFLKYFRLNKNDKLEIKKIWKFPANFGKEEIIVQTEKITLKMEEDTILKNQ